MINFVLKWTACALVVAGAFCTTVKWDPANICLLNAGTLVYLIWSLRIKEWNLVVVNGVLLAIYLAGAALRA